MVGKPFRNPNIIFVDVTFGAGLNPHDKTGWRISAAWIAGIPAAPSWNIFDFLIVALLLSCTKMKCAAEVAIMGRGPNSMALRVLIDRASMEPLVFHDFGNVINF